MSNRKNLFVGDAVLVPTLEANDDGQLAFSGSYNMVPISAVLEYQIEQYLKHNEFAPEKTKRFDRPKNIADDELTNLLNWIKSQENQRSTVLQGGE